MLFSFTEWMMLLTGAFGAIGWVGWSVWWLSKQFSLIRHLIYERIDGLQKELLAKLEYHERHDDQRFKSITDDLIAIRIRNAARDRIIAEEKAERKIKNNG